jgi:hypothetical protein
MGELVVRQFSWDLAMLKEQKTQQMRLLWMMKMTIL